MNDTPSRQFFCGLGDPPFTPERGYAAVAELTRVGLPAEVEEGYSDNRPVRVLVCARVGNIRLIRAWRYWVAKGAVPLSVAQYLYADPVGRKEVRVAGHCGCPPPEEWVETVDGKPCITTYHIDTEEGLALFVCAIKYSIQFPRRPLGLTPNTK